MHTIVTASFKISLHRSGSSFAVERTVSHFRITFLKPHVSPKHPQLSPSKPKFSPPAASAQSVARSHAPHHKASHHLHAHVSNQQQQSTMKISTPRRTHHILTGLHNPLVQLIERLKTWINNINALISRRDRNDGGCIVEQVHDRRVP
jgi:hypothetical protein